MTGPSIEVDAAMVGPMYFLGAVSPVPASFPSGITVVTAAAFFVIGYVLGKRRQDRRRG